MKIETEQEKQKRREWVQKRIKMAEDQGVIKCAYCGAYSGIFKISLKKFHLPRSKKKAYLCNDHWNKAAELDEVIWTLDHPDESGLTKARQERAVKEKVERESLARRKKIRTFIVYLIMTLIFAGLCILLKIYLNRGAG